MSFKDIALPLAARGIPVIPLGSNSKKAYLKDWQNLASTDPTQIEKWDASAPDGNCGCVAKAVIGGFWFLELDAAGEALRIKNETQKDLPQTLLIRSRAGRGHLAIRLCLRDRVGRGDVERRAQRERDRRAQRA